MVHDVLILGAGAAGLLCAIRAAERGRRVLLLEKNRRPGVKILISGGTRCNITNARDVAGIVEAFGPKGRFLYPALGALPPEAVVRLFEDEGVETKVEDDVVPGKVFPVSDRAPDVVDALLRRLARSGATIRTGAPALVVRRAGGGEARDGARFVVDVPDGPVAARTVVITTGGRSYARCGTAGDGYAFAHAFGHTIVEPQPALVPLVVPVAWVRELRGVTVPDAAVEAVAGRARVARRRGSVLFTHFGVSGPAVLDVSGALVRAERPWALRLDLLPALSTEALDAALREWAGRPGEGGRLARSALAPRLPERLAAALVAAAAIPADRRLSALARDERARLVEGVKRLELPVEADRGFAQAEVTSGGVHLDEVDPRTLESRRVPGLHLAGEVLDLDGPIGGFNFQSAWSTGWLAGERV